MVIYMEREREETNGAKSKQLLMNLGQEYKGEPLYSCKFFVCLKLYEIKSQSPKSIVPLC